MFLVQCIHWAGWGSVGPGGQVGHGCRSFTLPLIAQDAGVYEYLITDQALVGQSRMHRALALFLSWLNPV
jgi:hypothetical protein